MLFFFDPTHETLLFLLFGVFFSALGTALLGTLNFLQKKGLAADAVAHSLLPGIACAFLLDHSKNPFFMLLGGMFIGGAALFFIDKAASESKIAQENVIAVVLSFFLGLGLLLISYLQRNGDEGQLGLQSFLLGNIASLMEKDVFMLFVLGVIVLFLIGILFKEWQLFVFDPDYARSIGRPVKWLSALFYLLTLVSIVLGVQSVGVILLSSMFLIPGAAALFWTSHLGYMLLLAVFFNVFSSFFGVFVASSFPNLPTGPCVICVLFFFAFFSFLFAPWKGIIARLYYRDTYTERIWEENLLKLLYELEKEKGQKLNPRGYSMGEIYKKRPFDREKMIFFLKKMVNSGDLTESNGYWQLTDQGRQKGSHVKRLHLLWEAYTTRYMFSKEEEGHQEAEALEHLITSDLVKKIEEVLPKKSSD